MGRTALFSVLFPLLVTLTEARLSLRLHHRKRITQKAENEPAYVEQPISHFTDLGKTWKQMYNYDYSFQKQYKGLQNNVAFLEIGQEGPGCSVGGNGFMMDLWAAKYNASRFCLEHRYYGDSRPFPKQTVEALKYLSSKEMIGDLKHFIEYMNKENQWTGTKWVVFGGSYSGSLAAWMRQLHPDTVVGAVASSAPLEAVLDFYQYNEVVERTLAAAKDSPNCRSKIKDAFSNLTVLLRSDEGRANLSQIFSISSSLNPANLSINDVQNLYGVLAFHFQDEAQYDFDRVKLLCKLMERESNPIIGLQAVLNLYDPGPKDTSYLDGLKCYRDNSYRDTDCATLRSWLWQTCTEFGFYQTFDYAESIFGPTVSSSYFINICMDVFGEEFDADYITAATKATDLYYGGVDGYNGTNVVLINGDYDPWSALGRYRSDHYSQVTYLVKGGSHCGDMYSPIENVTIFDTVHKITAQHLDNWINAPPEIPNVNSAEIKQNLRNERQRRLEKRFPKSTRPYKPQRIEFDTRVTLEDLQRSIEADSKSTSWRGKEMNRWKLRQLDLSKVDLDQVNTSFFTQPVSHYNNTMVDTFQQQWWINKKFAKPNGPRFLMFGGESHGDYSGLFFDDDQFWMNMAEKYGATMYLNQHRCYEIDTAPKRDFDLSYCNSWEALGDAKHFIEMVNYHENTTGPWIVFGGSYPGMLALWARDKFPELIRGAVGSSAPVNPKLDFYGYRQVGDHLLQQYNKSCADFIRRGYEQVHQLTLSNEGLAELSTLFNLNPVWNDSSSVDELDMLTFSRTIQRAIFDFQNDGLATIFGTCAEIRVDEKPVNFLGRMSGGFNNYQDALSEFHDMWYYQKCKEFGFFHTVEYGHRIFDASAPVNFDLRLCQDAYGVPAENHEKESFSTNDIQGYIDETYEFYMSTFNATNIAAPNGNVDPWHVLGLLEPTNDQQLIILVNGTTHCGDMEQHPNDSAELKDAQRRIDEAIGEWLRQ